MPVAADAAGSRRGRGQRHGGRIEHEQSRELLLVRHQRLQQLRQVHHHQPADRGPVGRRDRIGLQRRIQPRPVARILRAGRPRHGHCVAVHEHRLAGGRPLVAQRQQVTQVGLQVVRVGRPARLREVAADPRRRRPPFGLAAQQAQVQRHLGAVDLGRGLRRLDQVVAADGQQDAVPHRRFRRRQQAHEVGRGLELDHLGQAFALAGAVDRDGGFGQHQFLEQVRMRAELGLGGGEPGVPLGQQAPVVALQVGPGGGLQILGGETGQVIQEKLSLVWWTGHTRQGRPRA